MKITKIGHCCLLLEDKGVRLLTDPGSFTESKMSAVTGLSAILFTHEHQDHYHLQSLRVLLKNNPQAKVFCNTGVASLLQKESIPHTVIGDGDVNDIGGISLEGHGTMHAVIHSSLPPIANTGFYIGGRLWYPGDELATMPGHKPEIAALPISGPWMKLSEMADYAIALQAGTVIPVHDMLLSDLGRAVHERVAGSILEPRGVRFIALEEDKEYEF